jgi:hypothetical protein
MARTPRATATIKMNIEEDSDLIAWWHSLPRGSRNAVMKDMMRDYIERNRGSYRPIYPRSQPQPFDPKYFMQLVEDAAWTRAALVELPGYVERVIEHVISQGVVQANTYYTPTSTSGSMSDDAARRREQRTRQARW